MRWYVYAGAALGLAAAGYAAGRFSAPDRVVTVTHETVRTVEDTSAREQVKRLTAEIESVKRDTHREEVLITRKDGTTERHVTTDRHVESERTQTAQTETQREETKRVDTVRESTHSVEIERQRPTWRLGPMVAIDLRTGALAYGGQVERRILGPLSLGVFGLSNGTAGAVLTLEF